MCSLEWYALNLIVEPLRPDIGHLEVPELAFWPINELLICCYRRLAQQKYTRALRRMYYIRVRGPECEVGHFQVPDVRSEGLKH
jgi:hypothetical protein